MSTTPQKYPPLRPLTKAEQRWVEENHRLAWKEAHRVGSAIVNARYGGRRGATYDHLVEELASAGITGLCIGIQRFDPTRVSNYTGRTVKPSSFVMWWVRQQIQQCALTVEMRLGKKPSAGLKFFSECGGTEGRTRDELMVEDRRSQTAAFKPVAPKLLAAIQALLTDKEMRILLARAGGTRLHLIGQNEKCSKEMVRQHLLHVRKKLRECQELMAVVDDYGQLEEPKTAAASAWQIA